MIPLILSELSVLIAVSPPESEGRSPGRRGERYGDPLGDAEADPRRRERGVGDRGTGAREDRLAEDDGDRVRRAAAPRREGRGDEVREGWVRPSPRGGRVRPPREGRPVPRRPLRRRERQARQVRRHYPRLRARGPRARARLQADARLHDRNCSRGDSGSSLGASVRIRRPGRPAADPQRGGLHRGTETKRCAISRCAFAAAGSSGAGNYQRKLK